MLRNSLPSSTVNTKPILQFLPPPLFVFNKPHHNTVLWKSKGKKEHTESANKYTEEIFNSKQNNCWKIVIFHEEQVAELDVWCNKSAHEAYVMTG